MKKIILSVSAFLMSVCLLCACGETHGSGSESTAASHQSSSPHSSQQWESVSKEIFAMDTYMTVTAYGERAQEAVDAAEGEIKRLDALLSTGNPESEISKLNAAGSAALSEDSRILVERSLELYRQTDGAYDITIYPIMQLWGFTGDQPSLPDNADIMETLSRCGSNQLTYSDGMLTLGTGQGIDFGAIAKGYTSGRIMEIFEEYGIISGVVSLGGNVQCYKTKTDGSLWRCGITHPDSPDDNSRLLGIVSAEDKAVITSGGYERFFIDQKSGKNYHHIMDPKTGYPAESGLVSVTVISPDGMLADGLSTSCFVMGEEKTVRYWREHSDEFDLVLMTEDGRLLVTEGLTDYFQSDLEYVTIYRKG